MDAEKILDRWTEGLGEATDLATLSPDVSYRPTQDPAPAPPLTGAGQFETYEEIGRGGMGVVFRARQLSLEREVALKKLQPAAEGSHRSSRCSPDDFLAEAVVTGRLEHPNIVPVYALELDAEGEATLAMKLITGKSWREVLRDESQPDLQQNLETLLQVCNAVAFAHSRGIAHNDLKPSNVMLGAYGEVLVVDWGLAVDFRAQKTPGSRVRHKSSIRLPCGTPNYIAPELALGDGQAIGPWTDIFLLGAILFELLSGHPPRRGRSLVEVVVQVADGKQIPLEADVPEELKRICLRALQAQPDARYASVEDFAAALRDFLRHRESLLISDQASIELDAINAEFDAAEHDEFELLALYDRFCACRFGFKHALQIWPGNEEARGALQRSLEWLIGYELGKGNSQSAAMLLPELPDRNPELAAQVSELRQKQSLERAEWQKLKRAVDPELGKKQRAQFAQLLAFLFCGFALLGAWSPIKVTPLIYALSGIADVAAVALCLWFFRESLLQRTFNGRIAVSVSLIACGILIHRALMLPLGVPVDKAVAAEILVYFLSTAMMAVAFDIRFLWASGSFLSAAVYAAIWPQHSWFALAVGSFVGITALKKAWCACPFTMQKRSAEDG